jgi:hypothetical protein
MIDNLIQLILIVSLCRALIHLPESYIFGKILPGAAISTLRQFTLRPAGTPARVGRATLPPFNLRPPRGYKSSIV